LTWLFIGRVISGITSASISTAFAYIADVTPPERRAAMFGKVGVAFGAGFILGPALGGLLGGMDPRLPVWGAAGLACADGRRGGGRVRRRIHSWPGPRRFAGRHGPAAAVLGRRRPELCQ